MSSRPTIAYFSMEIALASDIPTYSGGLGGLAGDTIRSAADLDLDLVAVSLVHRRGYFRQQLGPGGSQIEAAAAWDPQERLEELSARTEVVLAGRTVHVRAWRYWVDGVDGGRVPVVLLDTQVPENAPEDRHLTDRLYGGDDAYRLRQEVLLGIGGVRMLRALGYAIFDRYHLNEGHAALAALELIEEQIAAGGVDSEEAVGIALSAVRRHCVFTTHTPVAAGHDRFPMSLVASLLPHRPVARLLQLGVKDELNLTHLALGTSHFVNGVAMRHGEVSQGMFPDYPIHAITNGVHPVTWAAPPVAALFDRHIPSWRRDAFALRYAVGIPREAIAQAHRDAKGALLEHIGAGAGFSREGLTLAFARRATAYKRAALLFRDLERLRLLARKSGPLQVVFAGKAHPRDQEGKDLIARIHQAADALRGSVPVVYLPDYDVDLARLLVSGSDVWLNTPVPPLEASGTSGMKAALNGVPSLSVLDGWWLEGHVEGVTGWAIGQDGLERGLPPEALDARHAESLYEKLELAVMPTFYGRPDAYVDMMRHAMALNGSFFNTQRMVLEYSIYAYRDPDGQAPA